MTCNTSTRKVRTTPALDQLVNSFFNTAVGDLIYTPSARKHITRPATNVQALEDSFILDIALPGLSKTDVDITIENEVLTISDNRDQPEALSFRLREFNYAGFKKTFQLPEEVDTDKVSAAFDNGILSITLQKEEEAKPQPAKTINIQ